MSSHDQIKQAAAQWARDLLKHPFVVIDTETTGLDDRARIVSIGVIRVEDRKPKVLINTLINPQQPIPGSATKIHHITDDMVQDAPTFPAVYPAIVDALTAVAWVGYNVHFDHNIIRQECERAYLLTPCPPETIRGPRFEYVEEHDAMVEYADFWGDYSDYHGNYKWQRLANTAKQQHLPDSPAHNALGDCWTTYHLILKMSQF